VRIITVQATATGTDDVHDLIRAEADYPAPGSEHPRCAGYYCKSVSIDSGEGPHLFTIRANYTTERVDATGTTGDPLNPMLSPPKVRWDSMTWQRQIDTDIAGFPICSSAGEPYDPPYTITESCPVLVYTRNYSVATWSASSLGVLAYRVNLEAFTLGPDTVGAGEAMIDGQPIAEYVPPNGSTPAYYQVTFRIALKLGQGELAWQYRPVDMGYRQLNDDGDLVTVCDASGAPLNQPSLLNGSGHLLPSGDPPVFREFIVRDSVDMGGWGLVLPG
jgi:hypothetical protein